MASSQICNGFCSKRNGFYTLSVSAMDIHGDARCKAELWCSCGRKVAAEDLNLSTGFNSRDYYETAAIPRAMRWVRQNFVRVKKLTIKSSSVFAVRFLNRGDPAVGTEFEKCLRKFGKEKRYFRSVDLEV